MTGAVKEITPNIGLRKLHFNFPNWGDDANANMDILDASLGAIGLTNIRGIWDNSVAYVAGDKLIDDDLGSLWVCVIDHTSAASGTFQDERTAQPTYWDSYGTADTDVLPLVDGVSNIGAGAHPFDTLFIDNKIDFGNGDVTFDYATNIVTVTGGDLRVATPGTNAASVVTVGGTQTLTNKTLTGAALNGTLGATTPSTVAGTTGTFSGALSATTGTFSGALSAGAISATSGTFSSTVIGGSSTGSIAANVGTSLSLEVRSAAGAGNAAFMTFHRPGAFASTFGLDTDNVWKVGGWSAGAVSYRLYHAGSGDISHTGSIGASGNISASASLFSAVHVYAGGGFITTDGTFTAYCNSGANAPIQATASATTITGTLTASGSITANGNLIAGNGNTYTNLLRWSSEPTADTYLGWIADGSWRSVNNGIETFRSTSAAFAVSATGLISTSVAEYGFSVSVTTGETTIAGNTVTPLRVKRNADGALVNWYSGTGNEGSVAVAGTTISYNAFMGSHWSRLADGSIPDILRGTIVESLDALVEWDDSDNDRLPQFKVSDTVASKAVYGIFWVWDTDDDYHDAYIAALGASWIRIASGEVIQKGDLIESNGDGCGRVQADDIVRASTVGKITSTTVVDTYVDGSFLVPCMLKC